MQTKGLPRHRGLRLGKVASPDPDAQICCGGAGYAARPQPPRHVAPAPARPPPPDRPRVSARISCPEPGPGSQGSHSGFEFSAQIVPLRPLRPRAQVARGFLGGNPGPAIAVLASWRSPLAALLGARVAPLAAARIRLLTALAEGFNGGIIFTQQTPLEVS